MMGSGGGLETDDLLLFADLSSIKPLLLERLLFAKAFSILISLLIPIPDVIVIDERLEKLSRFPKPMLGVYEDVRLVADLQREDDLCDLFCGSVVLDETLEFLCDPKLDV